MQSGPLTTHASLEMMSLLPRELALIFLFQLPWLLVSGTFTVKGPEEPIIALVGREAIFQCHLSSQESARYMEVIWFHGQSSRVVHHYKYQRDYMKDQHQDYQGRTEFIRDNIDDGIVALKLRNIRPSDEGTYWCYFEHRDYNNEKEFQVYVADKGSASHIYLKGDGNKMLQLVCISTGWYPEPEVQWRKNQENLLAQETRIKKNENGLFSIESSITVSPDSAMNVSCFIQNPLLNQTLEANITLADALCPNDSSWMLTWSVTLVLVSTVFCNLIFQNQELKKDKDKYKTEHGLFKAECDKLHITLAKLQAELEDKLLQPETGPRIAPENPEKPTPQELGMENI